MIGHRRTTHLQRVLDSISNLKDAGDVKVLIQLQNPTHDVLEIAEHWPRENKTIFVIEKTFSNSMSAINNNVFSGIHNAFTKLNGEYCLLLEDDIVVMPTALQYISSSFEKYEDLRNFRGVNCFSRMVVEDDRFYVAKSNYGFAWGWAINRRTFLNLSKFWNGLENNHWDFLIEPFVRTGFVINPFVSQVLNIGFDNTATHSGQDKIIGEQMLQSAQSNSNQIFSIIENDIVKFTWGESLFDLGFLSISQKIKLHAVNTLVFRISLLEMKFPRMELLRMKLIRYRDATAKGVARR